LTVPGRRASTRQRDRGAATVELAGYAVVVFTLLTLAVQLVLWGLAAFSARIVADHALQAARVYQSDAGAGQAEAAAMLSSTAGRGLRDPQVTVTRTATTVIVHISGHAAAVVPGLEPTVNLTVSAPVERPT
jgi:hypothetical protein